MTEPMDILIVEDEFLLAIDIQAIVEDRGRHVLAEAASLRDVEELPEDLHPHLAFIDVNLAEGSSGFDVCTFIRSRWPETIVVFVSANVAQIPSDFRGGHGAIAKPFSHEGVALAIRYLADGVFDPPPSLARPSSLLPSPHLEARWDRL